MKMTRMFSALAMLFCFCLLMSTSANAGVIHLSDLSSDETNPEWLSATFTFEINDDSLSLTVANLTTSPKTYNINEIFFNASESVTGLSLTSANGTLYTPSSSPANSTVADGFGEFDYAVKNFLLTPSGSIEFIFTIFGSGVEQADFLGQWSITPPGDRPALAAAKFFQGENDDDSSYGAAVPVPPAALLLGSGLLGLIALRRRMKK
jgi:hypothetical protein